MEHNKVKKMKTSVTFGDVTVKSGEIGFGSLTTVELADSTPVKLPIIVMNVNQNGAIGRVLQGERVGTIVC